MPADRILTHHFVSAQGQRYAGYKPITEKKFSRKEIIDVIDAEVRAVERCDLDDWMTYFTKDALLEDPVGTGPFIGKRSGDNVHLSRFFRAFVGATVFSYTSRQDFVVGMEATRDVQVSVLMSAGVKPIVETIAYYKMAVEDGRLKIAKITAFWPFKTIPDQFMKYPLGKALTEMFRFSSRMIRVPGVKYTIRYFKVAVIGISRKGPLAVEKFVDAVNSRNGLSLAELFGAGGRGIQFPADGRWHKPAEFPDAIGENERLVVNNLRNAFWYTTCIFDTSGGGADKHGIAIFEFNRRSRKIDSARFFWEQ